MEIQFHIAHLFEIQSKFDLAKEAYHAIIAAPGMPANVQSVAWRQLGRKILFSHYFRWHILITFRILINNIFYALFSKQIGFDLPAISRHHNIEKCANEGLAFFSHVK